MRPGFGLGLRRPRRTLSRPSDRLDVPVIGHVRRWRPFLVKVSPDEDAQQLALNLLSGRELELRNPPSCVQIILVHKDRSINDDRRLLPLAGLGGEIHVLRVDIPGEGCPHQPKLVGRENEVFQH